MIYDTLQRLAAYRGLSGRLNKAIDFALERDVASLPLGRTDIDGDDVYVMIQEPTLQPESAALWEYHELYADIQLGLTDGETIAYLPRAAVREWGEYHPDVCQSADANPGIQLPLNAGRVALFMPWDAHKPGMGEGKSRKAVFKIRV